MDNNNKIVQIEIRDLWKQFSDKPVLTGANLDIYKGECIVIIGRSVAKEKVYY